MSQKAQNTQITDKRKVDAALLRRLANTVRGLSIDAIEAANSGHPGLPLGCADLAVTLWYHFLRYNPADPQWQGRDKFILSAGHGSMLIYSLLHLAGFDLSLDELRRFRQWGSKTPGHPENFMTPGVETTTGPLGQGFATGVGFALAEKMLAARINEPENALIDSYVYGIVSDGDVMEGVAMEAASFAGHLKLGNIIYLYDDNDISLDGPTSLSFGENSAQKFQAIGWHVQSVDGFDHQAIADAILAAQAVKDQPSLIICKTVIGYGSPAKAGSSKAHGSPLGKDEAKATKEKLGIPVEPTFNVPLADREAWTQRTSDLAPIYTEWQSALTRLRKEAPAKAAALDAYFKRAVPANIGDLLPKFDPAKTIATRKASEAVLGALGSAVPWLVGGSADLSGSTNAKIAGGGVVKPGDFAGREIYFGVREHAMGSICNGMTQQGAFRAYGGTFFTFSDYMRGAVRLGALMHAPSIWVWTHDSIFLGEDGPTHQSVEHLAAARCIPNLVTLRPGDANETAWAWVAALQRSGGPTALVLSRQNLPTLDRATGEFNDAEGTLKGAYILRPENDPTNLQGILIGTGSELCLCVDAAKVLEDEGYSVRVVSMPSWELFEMQDADYREDVLPKDVPARVAVEAGVRMGWERYIGLCGTFVGMSGFGASAPAEVLAKEFGFTTENVVAKMKALIP
ncbi:transketolase [bacterium]|nr:transketolase [bacterium]